MLVGDSALTPDAERRYPSGKRGYMNELNPDARLLIVDDSVANISLLRNILNRLGFTQIDTITDSRETFARLKEFRPDLIILDLNMPHLDGFAVMQQLSKLISRDTFLPVLVLTADATGETKRKALTAGATDLLTKPFNSSELVMRIRNLLHTRFLHLELRAHNESLETKVAERTRELREMQEQVVAQERLRAFGEMAGGIVHDFNNALMSVIGYSEMLLNDDDMLRDFKTARGFLQIMNTAGQDASQVISRLRDFYRPREVTDVFTRIDLNEVIEQAVPLTQPKWKGQALADGRTITVNLDLAKLPADLGQCGGVARGGDESHFQRCRCDAGWRDDYAAEQGGVKAGVYLEVSDSGVGMTDEVRAAALSHSFPRRAKKAPASDCQWSSASSSAMREAWKSKARPVKGRLFASACR